MKKFLISGTILLLSLFATAKTFEYRYVSTTERGDNVIIAVSPALPYQVMPALCISVGNPDDIPCHDAIKAPLLPAELQTIKHEFREAGSER
jgi:hypothetical protein